MFGDQPKPKPKAAVPAAAAPVEAPKPAPEPETKPEPSKRVSGLAAKLNLRPWREHELSIDVGDRLHPSEPHVW